MLNGTMTASFGAQVYEGQGKTPPRRAQLCVRLRETAFNAICSQLQERDETLYVAFQQHICFKVRLCCFCRLRRHLQPCSEQPCIGDDPACQAWLR